MSASLRCDCGDSECASCGSAQGTRGVRIVVEVELPLTTVSEANRRDHWAVKAGRAKGQRHGARFGLLATGIQAPSPPLVVELSRIAPRALDDDNLRGALKGVRDGVADWLGINDRDERVSWIYRQIKGPPAAVLIRVLAP